VSAAGFAFVGLAAFALPRFLESRALSRRSSYVIHALVAFVLIHSVIRVTFSSDIAFWNLRWVVDFVRDADTGEGGGGRGLVAAILLLALWIREVWRASDEVDLEMATRTIALPFALVLVTVVIGSGSERAGIIARGGAAFFAAAVVALAFAQLALSGANFGSIRAGGTTGVLLLGTAGGTMLSLLVLGVLFGLAGDFLLRALAAVVTVVLTIVLTPPLWIIEKLFQLLLSGAEFPEIGPPRVERPEGTDTGHEDRSLGERVALFSGRSLALLATMVAIGLVVWFVTRLARRRGPPDPAAPEREAAGGIGQDLRAGLRSLFRGGGGQRARLPGVAGLYLEVLRTAADRGHQRPLAITPREFQPELREAFAAPVTDEISAAYVEAAYAGREPARDAVDDLARRWRDSR
jgi:hypothetical protein